MKSSPVADSPSPRLDVVVAMDNIIDKGELLWIQNRRREKDSEEFGEIGLKTNCHYYGKVKGVSDCRILTGGCVCEEKVCHFYKKKG